MMRYLAISVTVVTLALLAGSAAGQATRPAAIESAGPTTAPEGQAIQAKVESVAGSVLQRSASQGGAFKPVAKGDMLPGDTLIAVGCKGQAVLTFGDNSAVVLEQFTVMTIDKVYERQQAGKPLVVTRLKLVNGSVRAGVERGRTDSDFRVTTPVATLSVRGTRPIRIFYDSGAPELWFYLAREGWITGQLSDGGKTVDVKGGEGTNQTLTNTLLIAMFERHVQFGDPLGEGARRVLRRGIQPERDRQLRRRQPTGPRRDHPGRRPGQRYQQPAAA